MTAKKKRRKEKKTNRGKQVKEKSWACLVFMSI